MTPPNQPPPNQPPPDDADDYTRTPRRPQSPSASRYRAKDPTSSPPPKPDPLYDHPKTDRPKDDRRSRADDRKDDRRDDRRDDDPEPSLWERTIGKRIDGLVPDLIKRTLTGTFGALFMSEDGLRQTLSDLKMPKELIQHVLSQADHTKRELMQTIARELREFLEVSNFYEELQRILTSLSFEIRTQIRLVPNDEAIVKPQVKNKVRVRRDPSPPKQPTPSDDPDDPHPDDPHPDDPLYDDDL